ncbi:MAG: flippase-like domain-containing protein [Elusimicrobia bacterium]|nr:flippase-like domain-containing protein [Elusimicrobiota bacterium]
MSARKVLSAAVALAFTAFFLVLALRNVEYDQLAQALVGVRWRWLPGIVFIIVVADIGIRALRWRILLSQAVQAPLGELYRLSTIGLAVNNLLFARLGELLRAVLAAERLGVSLATTLASVVVERVLDVAALLTLFVCASTWLPELVEPSLRRAAIVLLAAVLAALVFLIMAERSLEPGGFVERRLRSYRKVHELMSHLALGAAVLRRPRALFPVVGLSLALWSIDAAVYWLGAFALGLDQLIDYPRSILVLSWAGAGAALPAAPGAIGTYESLVKSIVVRLGASAPEALAYAVFLHMGMYILVTGMGLVFLYRVGLSLGGVKGFLRKVRA